MSTVQASDRRFYLLGDVHIEEARSGKVITLPRSIRGLLGYLLVYRHRYHPREILAEQLWSEHDPPRSRANLNTALWRLRSLVEPKNSASGAYLVESAMNEIKFNTQSSYWLDIEVLEEKVKEILVRKPETLTEPEISEAEEALQLYRGDLLEGDYSDWALGERERLRALYVDGLAVIAEYRAMQGAYQRALECGHLALRVEPLREDIHRTLIEIYAKSGRIAQALRQYQRCEMILRAELGIGPAEETIRLYDCILRNAKVPPVAAEPASRIDKIAAPHQRIC